MLQIETTPPVFACCSKPVQIPTSASSHGYEVGNPLNVAARTTSDPLVLKTLLDFGADVDSCGIDGMTGLIHAACRDNASFGILLLEYGASINATSATGQTPLTTAVAYSSHNIPRLHLDPWFEYSECPSLTGVKGYQSLASMDDYCAPIDTTVVIKSTFTSMSCFHKRQIYPKKKLEAAPGYDGNLSRSPFV